MSDVIPIHLAAEDELSEAVLRRLLAESGRDFAVGACYRRGGFEYLRSNVRRWNKAARYTPFVVLTDLDDDKSNCAPALVRQRLRVPRHRNLLLRVAVREVEAWLLADPRGLASWLSLRSLNMSGSPDDLVGAKEYLIGAARRSASRDVKRDILPRTGGTARQGPGYNSRMGAFVRARWNVKEAARQSDSLARAIQAISFFQPDWPPQR